ncbi:MAG: methylenetetrahydrofolate reductase C-terminal domain-containing protein [Proteobacteria bacterium]|nr:methylenetetrahydrofolate reductase C-terminal domain-containing protein [Pseudomonadota bacterium]MBU1714981.1 methylenetetrahydrofolate reductase C-terminal domain-containing protein [Pseudomonadota bacterium]
MSDQDKNVCSRFRQSLFDPKDFTLTFELVPSRGGQGKAHNRTLEFARQAAADGRLHAVSITENAGGHPALSPGTLGTEIRSMGLEVIVHLSCKDKNRNQMESLLFGWDRKDLFNLLVIAGDYPQQGYRGHPKPVFDLDTIQALDLISRLNCEQAGRDRRNPAVKPYKPTVFLKGVAVSPFKILESELLMQYFKLHRKAAAGADYVITQLGYDARKFHEVLQYMQLNNLNLPILGNVFVPNLPVVEIMRQGGIPGCVMPDDLYALIRQEAESEDKGKKARLIRAAKLLSVLKGIGYDGAHIGGPGLSFADFDFILSEAAQMAGSWPDYVEELSYWPENGFYYYKKDEKTGLNLAELNAKGKKAVISGAYYVARAAHELMFAENGLLFVPAQKICLKLADSKLSSTLASVEHLIKFISFNCQNCGDCTLAELAFLCPQSGCAKYLLNGACGGSRDGWCEVYPGRKRCLYVKVYERLKSIGREQEMKEGFVPPRDWSLNKTSSWINFYQGRDHTDKNK